MNKSRCVDFLRKLGHDDLEIAQILAKYDGKTSLLRGDFLKLICRKFNRMPSIEEASKEESVDFSVADFIAVSFSDIERYRD